MPFRMPRHDEHMVIVGRNGSGKTMLANHVLSKMDLGNERTVILDYKGDELINSLRRVRDLKPGEFPNKKGLYLMKLLPEIDDAAVESFFYKTWKKGNTRIYTDEGYMIPQGAQFRALLTQGRSLRIPLITLSQRPVEIDRFVFSEAAHVACFHLNDERDTKTVRAFTPPGFIDYVPSGVGNGVKLPPYWSRWYALKDDEKFVLEPCPSADEIRERIESKLERKHRWL